jgi:RNA polymerase sigma-70 factor (ECF subfamily)
MLHSLIHSTSHPFERTSDDCIDIGESGIVIALQAGSETAFTELYRRYAHGLYRRIFSITKNHEDAEDVLQETLMRAYLGLDSFEGRSKLLSWLTRIAINTSLMALRKRRVRPEACSESVSPGDDGVLRVEVKDPSPNPEEFCLQRERSQRLAKAMDALKPSLRDAIQAQVSREGSSMKEISRSLGVSVPAVKARLHRARRHLTERSQREDKRFPHPESTSQILRSRSSPHQPPFVRYFR